MSTCCICGDTFEARHSYGLCTSCFSRDAARELDRLENAKYKARKRGLVATLTLKQLLSVMSDFNGLCAFCQECTYSIIEMVEPAKGLTYDNVVASCKACHVRRAEGYDFAEARVRWYLSSDREQHETPQNEESAT
jgi:hypothetical protein